MTNTTGPAQQQGQPTRTVADTLSLDQCRRLMDLVHARVTTEADYTEALWRPEMTGEDKKAARAAADAAYKALIAYVYGEYPEATA